MAKRRYLGEFEQVVLLAVLRLGDGAYGVTIAREIEARCGRRVSLGAIYPTLDRLEREGCVSSAPSAPTPERGGRSRRMFQVSDRGLEALNKARAVFEALWEGLVPNEEPSR